MITLNAIVFYTNDIDRAINFYTQQIGLELEYKSGSNYASLLFHNGIKLGIKKAVEEREVPGAQTFILAIDDAKSQYEAAKGKGLHIYKELLDEPWALEFSVLDPDGNKIEYAQNK